MPGEPIYGLTERTKDSLLDSLRSQRRSFGPEAPPARDPGPYMCFVLCGAVEGDAGGFRYYNGTPKIFNAATGGYETPPKGGDDCVWLLSRIDLVAGQTYLAMGTGICTIDDTEKPGFVAEVRKFKWVRVITGDPECVDGDLVIPWEWAAVLDLGDASGFLLPPPPPP